METIKSSFTIDGLNVWFKGYTANQHWNGWECPYFEMDEAKRIAEAFEREYGTILEYNEETDTFLLWDEAYDEPEEFKGIDISFGGQPIRVYAIGAFGWCWVDESINELN
jgi:hypothetical protein